MSVSLPKQYDVIIHMRSGRVEKITYAREKFDSTSTDGPITTFQGVANKIMGGSYVVLPSGSESALMVIPAEIEYIQIVATPYDPIY